MDQVNSWWLSARAGHRHEPATSESLTIHQEDCELSQQKDDELYHLRDDVAESHDYGHKRRRLDADDHGIDHTAATWDPRWNVLAAADINMREDDTIREDTNELVLQPEHLSSQPSNDDDLNCTLAGQNGNLLSNTTGVIFSTDGIKISDVCLLNPPPKNNPKYKIVIKCGIKDDKAPENADRKGNCDNNRVLWKDPFVFACDITDKTFLTFTVQSKQFPKNSTIGTWECWAIDLFKMQSSFGSCKLNVSGECQLTFNINKISGLGVVSGVVEQASAELGSFPNLEVPTQTGNSIDSVAQVYNNNEQTWISFLGAFQVFMKVVDNVSEINIYAQTAWGILSVIPKTILSKRNRDDKVRQLCDKLKDIYEYITDAERFRGLTTTQSINQSTSQCTNRSIARWSTMLSTLVQQTIECAHFIRAYAKSIVKAIGGSVDAKIETFNDKLDHLIKVMTDSINLETGIITLRISGEITEHRELTLLGEMPYDSGAGYFPNKECLSGTRQTLIKEIFKWANNDSSTQILVLSGQAGKGKSAVAHTIAKMLKQHNRLGSMFCFNRSYADRRNRLFSTISRDLADGDIMWRKELINVINNNSAVRKKEDVRTQFNELIIKPSQNVATDLGPIVIVMDALDESGNREERREILEILFNEWIKLPKNYRMFVTTRPEQDIEDQCEKLNIPHKRMGDVDAEETCHDIEAFVSNRLNSISLILDSIDGNWRNTLAKRAEGLFQWAQTACQFIDPTTKHSKLIKKNWNACISNSFSSLNGLYRQIILNQSEAKDDDFVEDFKTVVGAIITAREPLSINALQNIFDDIEDIKSILAPFGSFFVGVHDLSTPVQPVHTSLFDFFVSKKNAEEINEYYIDTSDQSQMTLGCLKVMDRMLCFNICQLETSHLRNKEVLNFNARVEKSIPSHLSYSCRFWAFHLQSSPVSGKLIHEVRKLMDDKLLYYFEALSLLHAIYQGDVTMREIADWCKDTDDGLAADAMDACRFGHDFGSVMMGSTPHIYLSALPFTPRGSFVSKKYLDRYPGLFTFDIGQPVSPSCTIGIGQTVSSSRIAFSPNGAYIAAESRRGEFLVWNYITGEHLAYLKAGRARDSGICDIVFSLDGELVYCCFSGGDILVWNMGTKETRIESYRKIVGAECHHGTISSDGCFIIWQTDKGALVLDRTSRQIIKCFGEQYYFSEISPNGNWIALNRRHEKEVYIWDTRNQTQHCVMPCYSWGELALTDSYIAFVQEETTIEIWDVRANTKLTEIRSWKPVISLFLSPDDQYLLVTSDDMYWIWSVSTGELINQSYGDDLRYCLGFSHDSKSIALYTQNDTVHVQQWVKSGESNDPRGNGLEFVYAIWLRGSYLILHYESILGEYRLQISDVTTTNSIIFEARLDDCGPVSVAPNDENIHVAYIGSRGLCLWDDKEGEIIVDGSVRSITTLLCLDNYLIYGHGKTINIWNSCTEITHGPINLLYKLESLLPVRGTRFAVLYDDKAEVRDCELGNRVGEAFTFNSSNPPIAVSANKEHFICTSKNGVDILDVLDPTEVDMNSFSFSSPELERRLKRSLNGKYMAWIDNGGIKLFDVDAETLLVGPSLDQPVENFWLSDDSKHIIIVSTCEGMSPPRFLDIWDIQSENMIIETIRQSFSTQTVTLDLSKRRLVVITALFQDCYVWDLDTYEIMSSVYNAHQLAAGDSDLKGTSISTKTATLNYTSMACKKASLPTLPESDDSGWVLGLQGELLFWVPPKMRRGFWFLCTTHTPFRNVTKLNFTNFVHGSDWTKCKSGNN